jgi:peptide/nickel transport system permease protein
MDRSKNKGVNMDKKSYRKEKFNFWFYNFKKNWKLFQSSKYGKIGFYLILAFIIISLISPLIIQHSNALEYIAPQGDFTSAQKEYSAVLPDKITSISASDSSEEGLGSYLTYAETPKGIYGISTTNNTVYKLSTDVGTFNITAFTAYTDTAHLATYVMVANNTDIMVGKVAWSGGVDGAGKPSLKLYSMHVSSITSTPISSAFTMHSDIESTELECSIPTSSSNTAYIYVLNGTSGHYYLNEYNLYDIEHKVSSLVFSVPLNYSAAPSHLTFYAAGLSSSEEIFLTDGTHLLGYSTSGTLKTNIIAGSQISQLFIPAAYQSSNNKYNTLYYVAGNSVDGVNLINGSKIVVFNSSKPVSYISSTDGGDGFPAHFLIAQGKTIYILSAPNTITTNITLHIITTGVLNYKDNFLFYNNDGDLVYFAADELSDKIPSITWALSIAHSSLPPTFLLNPKTALESFSFAYGNTLNLYSAKGKDMNPLPPTFHTVTGNIFPLGTTDQGNDVWSEFIGSFPTDLEIGLSVGIGILVLSLLIGLLIGYFSGIVSSTVETFALAIYLIPGLPLLIVVAAIVGPSLLGIIAVLTLLSWPFAAFTLIGIVRSLKSRTFVDAAKVSGAGTFQIMKNHMVKNVTPILIYLTAINIGGAVAAVSTLQVLGIAPLTVPTWGGMLDGFYSDAFDLAIAPWWFIPPIIAITLFIMAFIFVSRGMDNVVNPRAGGRR